MEQRSPYILETVELEPSHQQEQSAQVSAIGGILLTMAVTFFVLVLLICMISWVCRRAKLSSKSKRDSD